MSQTWTRLVQLRTVALLAATAAVCSVSPAALGAPTSQAVHMLFTGTYAVLKHTTRSTLLVADGFGDVPRLGRATLELRLKFGAHRGRVGHCAGFTGTGFLARVIGKNRVALAVHGAECANPRSKGTLENSGTFRVVSSSGTLRGASGSGKISGFESTGSNGTVVERLSGTLTIP